MPPAGPPDAAIFLLGEGPGANETSQRTPFCGNSGKLLNDALRRADLPRAALRISNCGLCEPKVVYDSERRVWLSKGVAKVRSIEACRERLIREVIEVQPRVIVATGGHALEQLTGLRGMAKYHGSILRVEFGALREGAAGSAIVVPLYHPAFLLRGKPQYFSTLIDGLIKVKRIATEGLQPEPTLRLISPLNADPEADLLWLEQLIDQVEAEGWPIAVDVETTSAVARTCDLTIVGFGIAALRLGVSISVRTWDAVQRVYRCLWSRQLWARVHALIQRMLETSVPKWYHNFGFDVTVLERWYNLRGSIGDTIILHHLYQPDLPHDLGWVAQQELDVPAWKVHFHALQKAKKNTDADELLYNAQDAVNTALAVKPLLRKCKARRNAQLIAHQLRVAELARKAHKRGIPIDLAEWLAQYTKHAAAKDEYLVEMQNAIRDTAGAVDSLNAAVAEARGLRRRGAPTGEVEKKPSKPAPQIGWQDFNPLSPDHARWFLYTFHEIEPERFTKGGAEHDETKKAASYSYKGVTGHLHLPLIKAFVKFAEERGAVAILSTIISACDVPADLEEACRPHRDSSGKLTVTWDLVEVFRKRLERGPCHWRLHVSWNTTGQKGSRWSSKPNAQNWRKAIRKVTRQPKGRKWVGADAAQIEYRIAACLAGITDLLALFNQDPFDEEKEPDKKYDGRYDAHAMVAASVYGSLFTDAIPREVNACWAKVSADLEPGVVGFFAALGAIAEGVAKGRKEQAGLRTFVKRVVYAMFYGATPEKIHSTLMEDPELPINVRAKLTLERVRAIVEGFRSRFPEWDRWADREMVRVRHETGCQVIPPFRRHRWWGMPSYDGAVEGTKLRNTPIQVSAGDVVNAMFVAMEAEVVARGLDGHFIVHAHDACGWDCSEEDAPAVRDVVNKHFDFWLESTRGHKVHIYGQAKIGETLADV